MWVPALLAISSGPLWTGRACLISWSHETYTLCPVYSTSCFLPHTSASVCRSLYGSQARFFEDELHPGLKHAKLGVVGMAGAGKDMNASQFYITLGSNLDSLDGKHTIFGEVSMHLGCTACRQTVQHQHAQCAQPVGLHPSIWYQGSG